MLSLKESKAATDLAQFLCEFLPGSGYSQWKGHVSFKTVAEKVGVGDFWEVGSKLPVLTSLLQRTLERRRHLFEPLILEIVRAGIIYRKKEGRSLKPEDIDTLNGLILQVGFKFPDLWDPDFKNSLRLEGVQRAQDLVSQAIKDKQQKESVQLRHSQQALELRDQFFELCGEPDRRKAGLALEKVLNSLFALHGLTPRDPFRVVGEQIDGSFELDHETYLIEAKWEKEPLPEGDLLTFRGKIEGKSAYTRGLFVSISGISNEAKTSIVRGKQPTFFVVDGYDLAMVLSESIELTEFLRQRRRILAEEGLVVVPYSELWNGSRKRN
ncbi:MAG: hypothetical protein FJ115_01785 [Deltaproteobacteria bacterium]|nr:hypothetical protein [Deltaproteobacteria bacterium]MBM4322265.1 hypothetical protein [Deltaproteobacteria bacterium]